MPNIPEDITTLLDNWKELTETLGSGEFCNVSILQVVLKPNSVLGFLNLVDQHWTWQNLFILLQYSVWDRTYRIEQGTEKSFLLVFAQTQNQSRTKETPPPPNLFVQQKEMVYDLTQMEMEVY